MACVYRIQKVQLVRRQEKVVKYTSNRYYRYSRSGDGCNVKSFCMKMMVVDQLGKFLLSRCQSDRNY
jgi:hypothetical protein